MCVRMYEDTFLFVFIVASISLSADPCAEQLMKINETKTRRRAKRGGEEKGVGLESVRAEHTTAQVPRKLIHRWNRDGLWGEEREGGGGEGGREGGRGKANV